MTIDRRSRRAVLASTGLAAAALAGCLGDDDDGADADPEDWEGVTEIELDGHTNNWTGLSPDPIDGVENPTLVLTAGTEYTVTWYNQDGAEHNIALVDDDGEAIEASEWTNDDEQTFTFEATEEMVEYLCEPHRTTMVGDVDIQTD